VQTRVSLSFTPVETALGLFTFSGVSEAGMESTFMREHLTGCQTPPDTVIETGNFNNAACSKGRSYKIA
jgi:hypothetical protein